MKHVQHLMKEKSSVMKSSYAFVNEDGILCSYFSLEYMQSIAEQAGLKIKELHYATVIIKNRKTRQELR